VRTVYTVATVKASSLLRYIKKKGLTVYTHLPVSRLWLLRKIKNWFISGLTRI
jgi:hypothetical protein